MLRSLQSHPRIHPKLRRLTRKYRCLGGIPCADKLLKVKVRCRLTRKRSLVRIQSCLPYLKQNQVLTSMMSSFCSWFWVLEGAETNPSPNSPLTQLPRLFLAFAVSMKGSASFSIKVGVRSKIVTNEYQHLYCIE